MNDLSMIEARVFLRSDITATVHLTARFVQLLFEPLQCIRGQRLFLWKALRCQRRLDKVRTCTSEMVTVARHCQ